MTRAEAVKCLIYIKQRAMLPNFVDSVEAIDMAIEALSKPNYETDTEVRLAVTDRNKDKVVLWDAFGEVEYYPHGEINEPTQTHGRLIDADALSKKLCGTTIFIKDGEAFQRMINDAPTVQADRPSKADKDGMDMEQAKEYCKACQHNEVCRYYPYDGCHFKDTDRPHGEWVESKIPYELYVCSNCGGACWSYDYERTIVKSNFCPNCGADMRKENK